MLAKLAENFLKNEVCRALEHGRTIFLILCYALTIEAAQAAPFAGDPLQAPQRLSCTRYDSLQAFGTRASLISTCDTVDPTLAGLRKPLYDRGWSFQASINAGGTYDVRGHEERPQLYSGQDPSFSALGSFYATYDLSRIGFAPKSQLVATIWTGALSFKGDVPGGSSVSMLYANQTFMQDRLQLQYGFDSFIDQFYGFYPGGNTTASAALGVSSLVPIQVGFVNNKPAPEINAKWSWSNNRWYDRFGVTRSMSPDGLHADWDENNAIGLKLKVPGARALFVNELGYETRASASERSSWLRQGVIYNTSQYAWVDGSDRRSRNYALYFAMDIQFTQSDIVNPGLGWYINSTIDYAPSSVNYYPRDVSIIFYKLGPFHSRPDDTWSIGASYNWVSDSYQKAAAASGISSAKSSRSFASGYIAKVSRGIYWINQLTYTFNPVAAPRRPAALNWTTDIAFAF